MNNNLTRKNKQIIDNRNKTRKKRDESSEPFFNMDEDIAEVNIVDVNPSQIKENEFDEDNPINIDENVETVEINWTAMNNEPLYNQLRNSKELPKLFISHELGYNPSRKIQQGGAINPKEITDQVTQSVTSAIDYVKQVFSYLFKSNNNEDISENKEDISGNNNENISEQKSLVDGVVATLLNEKPLERAKQTVDIPENTRNELENEEENDDEDEDDEDEDDEDEDEDEDEDDEDEDDEDEDEEEDDEDDDGDEDEEEEDDDDNEDEQKHKKHHHKHHNKHHNKHKNNKNVGANREESYLDMYNIYGHPEIFFHGYTDLDENDLIEIPMSYDWILATINIFVNDSVRPQMYQNDISKEVIVVPSFMKIKEFLIRLIYSIQHTRFHTPTLTIKEGLLDNITMTAIAGMDADEDTVADLADRLRQLKVNNHTTIVKIHREF
jgi:hypothetical protein